MVTKKTKESEMRIEAKTSADIVAINVKRNNSHDGKEAFVDLEIGIKEGEAPNFGKDFADLAFSGMREEVTEEGAAKITHLQDSIKPGSRVVYERHVIVLDGNKLKEQPELLNLKTVDGDAKVVAKVRVPVATTQTDLITSLMGKVGNVVAIEFNPEQQLMTLNKKPETETEAEA